MKKTPSKPTLSTLSTGQGLFLGTLAISASYICYAMITEGPGKFLFSRIPWLKPLYKNVYDNEGQSIDTKAK